MLNVIVRQVKFIKSAQMAQRKKGISLPQGPSHSFKHQALTPGTKDKKKKDKISSIMLV